jgi:hypothetical protein
MITSATLLIWPVVVGLIGCRFINRQFEKKQAALRVCLFLYDLDKLTLVGHRGNWIYVETARGDRVTAYNLSNGEQFEMPVKPPPVWGTDANLMAHTRMRLRRIASLFTRRNKLATERKR